MLLQYTSRAAQLYKQQLEKEAAKMAAGWVCWASSTSSSRGSKRCVMEWHKHVLFCAMAGLWRHLPGVLKQP